MSISSSATTATAQSFSSGLSGPTTVQTNIRDHYEPLELIGRGTFGQIRKVKHKVDGHILVRKEISYGRMSQRERNQLLAELRILKGLRHQNIVQYVHHERDPDNEEVHLYMEYCGGGDLSQLIRNCRDSNQYVPETIVWSILTQILLALYRCHYGVDAPPLTNLFAPVEDPPATPSSVILHRDIKPENVFLDSENSVKLGDFGLSKMIGPEHTLATTYVGTPYYMSPEVLLDQPYTPQSDMWSLGCVIYELCALHPPFTGKSHLQLAQTIKEGRYPPLPSGYSTALQHVIAACLTLNPQKRPTTHDLLQIEKIRIHRRERELVELHRELKLREETISRREQEIVGKESEIVLLWEKHEQSEKELIQQHQMMQLSFEEAVEIRAQELAQQFILSQQQAIQQDLYLQPPQQLRLDQPENIPEVMLATTPRNSLATRHSISDLRQAYNSNSAVSASPMDISYSPYPSASPLGTFPSRVIAAAASARTPIRPRTVNEIQHRRTEGGRTSPFLPSASPMTISPSVPHRRKARETTKASGGVRQLSALDDNVEISIQQIPAATSSGAGLGAAAARAKIMASATGSKTSSGESWRAGDMGRTILDIQRDSAKKQSGMRRAGWLMKNEADDSDLPSPFMRRVLG
ncbi:kinase-like domain-containing protein [Lipomyces oligophaga]|uniref:kinase-like domain-containing protein n=1 Tax=Lipomyces oligophaga TaxID=45792 RepID=UPI0034CD3896